MNYLELESVGKPVYKEMVRCALVSDTKTAIAVASYFLGVFLRKADAKLDVNKPLFQALPNLEKGFEEADKWKVKDHSPPG